MRRIVRALVFWSVVIAMPANADDHTQQVIEATTLINAMSETAEGVDVIVSHVTLSPHASLAKHWHPGEEFVYLLEGSVTLSIDGEKDFVHRPGQLVKIPFKKVHWVVAGKDGATAIAFRLHRHGKPERVPVD